MTLTRPKVTMLNLDVTGTEVLTTNTDATSAAGPTQSFFRDSVSPAANDLLALLKFDGRDTAANRQTYASISAQILDPAVGSEDGAMVFSTWVAGAETVTMTLRDGSVGIGNSIPLAKLHVGAGADTPTAIAGTTISAYVSEAGPTAVQVRDSTNNTDFSVLANASGTKQITNGADATKHFIEINGQSLGFFYDQPSPGSGAGMIIGAANYVFNNPQTVGIQMHSNPYVADVGGTLPTGTIVSTIGNYASANLSLNRSTGDGELVAFFSAGSFIGNITCAGGVVSYNAFSGSHWSQLKDQSRQEILRGTIVETIDEMCSWAGEEPEFEEHLPKFKISDKVGSRRVYGVFMDWMHKTKAGGWGVTEEFIENDAVITSLGACLIRLDASVSLDELSDGPLIESAGNGCGRVQADDLFRASTVAKVTASVIIETYPDGSYLVPCTLHCG